jgi:acyl dehydratase
MTQRTVFTVEQGRAFAALSGDNNPLHTDESYSYRTPFGTCIVPGALQLLWWLSVAALNERSASRVHVEFLYPLKYDSVLELHTNKSGASGSSYHLTADGVVVSRIRTWTNCESQLQSIDARTEHADFQNSCLESKHVSDSLGVLTNAGVKHFVLSSAIGLALLSLSWAAGVRVPGPGGVLN